MSGNINPESGEEGARAHHEDVVENGVEGISLDLCEASGRTDVVGDSTNRSGSSLGVVLSPLSNTVDEEVVGLSILSVEDLGEEVEVGDEGSLQDDRDVRGIEQLNGERYFVTTHLSVSEGQFDAESLEVDNDKEHNEGSQQAGNVRGILTVEGVLEGEDLVRFSQEGVEKGNNGTFEFSILLSLDSNR